MSRFDTLDARQAAAIDRTFSDAVVWRPMVSGDGFIVQARPDPSRPVRGLRWFDAREIDDALTAILTWAPTGLPVAALQPGGGEVSTATLLVDFERASFGRDGWAEHGEPRRGDWIEMPEEKNPDNRLVEIDRVGDDGSARFLCWCNVVDRQ